MSERSDLDLVHVRAALEAELGLPVVEPCQAAAAAAVSAVRPGW